MSDRAQLDDLDAATWRSRWLAWRMERRNRPDLLSRAAERAATRVAALPAVQEARQRQTALLVALGVVAVLLLALLIGHSKGG